MYTNDYFIKAYHQAQFERIQDEYRAAQIAHTKLLQWIRHIIPGNRRQRTWKRNNPTQIRAIPGVIVR